MAKQKTTNSKTAKSGANKSIAENKEPNTVLKPKPTPASRDGKRHVVTSYDNLNPDALKLLQEKYPLGWRDYVIKVNKSNEDFFFAIMLDTPEVNYLIKVNVEVDSRKKYEADPLFTSESDDKDDDDEEDDPLDGDI